MRLFYSRQKEMFFCFPKKQEEKSIVKKAGLKKNPYNQDMWQSKDFYVVADLVKFAEGKIKEKIETKLREFEQAIVESRSTEADIKIPAPKGLEYRPFQKAGIAFSLKRSHTLNADDMRLGKTIQAIGHINYRYKSGTAKILIICPATIKLNWYEELKKWLVNKRLSIKVISSKSYIKANIQIINYDILKKWEEKLKQQEWDLLIADEAHKLKNMASKRTQIVFGAKNKKPIACKEMLLLTGSPIVNRPNELYSLLKALKTPFVKNYNEFIERYMEREFNGFGWAFKGGKNLNELQHKLRQTVMIRRKKADVFQDLPTKTRQIITLPEDTFLNVLLKEKVAVEKIEREKKKLEENVIAEKHSEKGYEEAVKKLRKFEGASMSEMAILRHFTAMAKLKDVVAHCETLLETEEKIVVYAHHVDLIKGLEENFKKYNPVVLYGAIKVEERMSLVKEFNQNKERRVCIIGIMLAQGMSLASADVGVFAELDWVPGNISQAEDRLFDMSKNNPILIQHIVIDGSIDSNLAKTLIEKQEIIDKSLDQKFIEEEKNA